MWKIIEDTEHRPLNPPADATKSEIDCCHAEQKSFDKRKRECITILKAACSESVRPYVSLLRCPIEIWETLKRKFSGTATAHARFALVTKFYHILLEDGEPLEDFFAKLIVIRDQLRGTSDEIMDSQFKVHVIRSMPPWVLQLCYQKPEMTSDELMDHLCNRNVTYT